MVVPFEENREALKVFMEVRYQFISDALGPIDINHSAIDLAMKRHNTDCFDKVITLTRWWVDRIRKK